MSRIIWMAGAAALLLATAGCMSDSLTAATAGGGRSYDCPGGMVSNQEASKLNGNMACADPYLTPGTYEF